jgi:hypothetical protein
VLMPLGQVELRRRGEQRDATARGAGTSAESMPCMCGARGAGSGSEGAAAAEVRPLSARYVEARRPCGRGRRGGLRATLSVLVLGRRSAGSESDRRPAATGGESGRGRERPGESRVGARRRQARDGGGLARSTVGELEQAHRRALDGAGRAICTAYYCLPGRARRGPRPGVRSPGVCKARMAGLT